MKSSQLTSIGMTAAIMIAAMMLLTGCSDRGSQSAGEALPAPMSSTAADGTVTAQEEAADSAFAAFDRSADGVIDESEWQNKEARSNVELKNMTFQQIDRDSSGGIDPDEFRSARADGGPAVHTGGTGRTVRDSDAEATDATGA